MAFTDFVETFGPHNIIYVVHAHTHTHPHMRKYAKRILKR